MPWTYLEAVTSVCFSKTSPLAGKIASWGTSDLARPTWQQIPLCAEHLVQSIRTTPTGYYHSLWHTRKQLVPKSASGLTGIPNLSSPNHSSVCALQALERGCPHSPGAEWAETWSCFTAEAPSCWAGCNIWHFARRFVIRAANRSGQFFFPSPNGNSTQLLLKWTS